MNRRGFLTKAWLMPLTLPFALMAEGVVKSDDPNFDYNYKGYRIRWTGWKGSSQYDDEFGQWLAFRDKEPARQFYSSVPGAVSLYYPGSVFDLALRKSAVGSAGAYGRGATFGWDWDQIHITYKTPQSVKTEEQAAGLRRLVHFIDEYGEEKD